MIVEDEGTISNAWVGVLGGDANPSDPGFVNMTPGVYGGVVKTMNAHFINNRFDVIAMEWIGTLRDNVPSTTNCYAMNRFVNTEFRTTDTLHGTGNDPVAHLRLADVEASVHGCTFANELGGHTESLRMGQGIEGFNAFLKVEPATQVDCSPFTSAGNSFSNLDHAVRNSTMNGTGYTDVRGNIFTDNICAVYTSGMAGLVIAENKIEMGRWADVELTHPDEVSWFGMHRGIYTDHCFGFIIQDDTLGLSPNAQDSALPEGIVVGYSGDHGDAVFRNVASGLEVGFIGEGICAANNPDSAYFQGLQLLCNVNDGNSTDLWSRAIDGADDVDQHTVRGYQGSLAASRPAGNVFDQSTDYDFRVTTTFATINYVWDSLIAQSEPELIEGQILTLGLAMSVGEYCAEAATNVLGEAPASIGDLGDVLAEATVAYASSQLLYDQLMDGGSTQELLDLLVSEWYESTEITEDILDLSPNITAVILEAIVLSNDFTLAQKTAILIANPTGTQRGHLVDLLEEENFPQYLIDMVIASWLGLAEEGPSYRTMLEMQMGDHYTHKAQALNGLLYSYQQDSAYSAPDSTLLLWQRLRTPAARFAEAGLLVGLERFEEAWDLMDAFDEEHPITNDTLLSQEAKRMVDYIDILMAALEDERTAYQLDSAEVAELDALILDRYDRPATWISNLLCVVYGHCRPPMTGGGGELEMRRLPQFEETNARTWNRLAVQPNPASITTTFTYVLQQVPHDAWLTVTDMIGRMVHHERIAQQEGLSIFGVSGLSAGVYTVNIIERGEVLLSERLVIQP